MACRSCGGKISGVRCSRCGEPIKVVGCLTVLVPTIIVAVIVARAIPSETVPRVTSLPGGATEYCFQSMRSAILWRVVPAAFVVFEVLTLIVFKVRKPAKKAEEEELRPGVVSFLRGIARRTARLLGWGLSVLIYAGLFWFIIGIPLTRWRTAEVDRDTLRLRSLFNSWTLPRSRIARTQFRWERHDKRPAAAVEMSFVVEDEEGGRYRSVMVLSTTTDHSLQRFTDAFKKLKAHLDQRE